MKYFFAILLFSFASVYSQEFNFEEMPIDSVWNLEDLDESDFLEEDYVFESSSGWLPKILVKERKLSFFFNGGFNIDAASGVRSENFVPTENAFSSKRNYSNESMEFREAFTTEEEEVNDLGRESALLGIDYSYAHPKLPVFLTFGAGARYTRSALFTNDEGKQFLHDNELKTLNEASSIVFKDWSMLGYFDFEIPIYGGFIKEDNTYSVFTFGFGFTTSYVIDHNAIQYFQILNNKDQIRYANGSDNYRVISNQDLPNTIKLRNYINLKLGWRASFFGSASADMGLKGYFPLQNVIDDGQWSHYQIDIYVKFRLKSFK